MSTPEHNFCKIPQFAVDLPEYILVQYLEDWQLEEHIQRRHEQQLKVMDAFINSRTKTDEEFHMLDEPCHDYQVSIREHYHREKAKRQGNKIIKIVTDKL